MANEDLKTRASRLMRAAGREHLRPLGATSNKSGRSWTIDRHWWLINIEFQPSSWSVGSYVNVGLQHLWQPRDFRVFEYSYRTPISGHGQFVELDGGDEETLRQRAATLAAAAREAADHWIQRFADDQAHLQWLTRQDVADAWQAFNAAFAHAALDERTRASEVFSSVAAVLNHSIEWQAELAADCGRLAVLSRDSQAFAAEADRRIDEARNLLRLPPDGGPVQ